jgi:hypothetical protein
MANELHAGHLQQSWKLSVEQTAVFRDDALDKQRRLRSRNGGERPFSRDPAALPAVAI